MPARRAAPSGYERAHDLRKHATPAETKLWQLLRNGRFGGITFRRQHAIGRYVVDFCAIRPKLIIELDGSPHREHDERQTVRDTFLASQGYRVLRFWNGQVIKDIDSVARAILRAIESA